MKCPICGNKNAKSTHPFASIYCSKCGFDEDFHNKETYKPKDK